jgi:hypothetical protein
MDGDGLSMDLVAQRYGAGFWWLGIRGLPVFRVPHGRIGNTHVSRQSCDDMSEECRGRLFFCTGLLGKREESQAQLRAFCQAILELGR